MRLLTIVMHGLVRAGSAVWLAARRRPRVALIVAAMVVLFAPLGVDLFFVIPWPVRKAGGWLAFAGLLAACTVRLWRVEPGDEAPPADEPRVLGWTCFIPPLACAVMAVTYLKGPGNFGFGDWDYYLSRFEAVRRSILFWGQFPWWDPWCRGGFPLAANPQCGVIGLATPLVLLAGTSLGLRLAQLGCLLIAMEGARRLALFWLREPVAALAAGLIYGINGGVLSLAVAGYYLPMSFCSLPWLLYHAFRLDRRCADGALLGLWLAFSALNGIHYFTIYSLLILAVVWLRGLRVRSGPARARFLLHSALAAGILLALAGWRLATTALVCRDFPRIYRSGHDLAPWSIVMYLLARPRAEDLARMEIPEYWETLWYVGPVVLALAAISLISGWRWWHTLTAACVWLAAGSEAWYHPSYWLAHFPPFTTMHVVTRWRYMAMLGFAVAASDVLARWRRGGTPALRRIAAVAVLAIAADYVLLGCQVLHLGFRIEPNDVPYPGPPTPELVQVRTGLGLAAIERGYGVILLQEPMLGYDLRLPTARLWRGHPEYVGEWWTESGRVQPRSWSPNRVVLQVEPRQTVSINQNPGSWWTVNGRPAFPDWRCAETERAFVARADNDGRVELQIRPRGLELGLALDLVGFAVIGMVMLGTRSRKWQGESRLG
jgi:hypothetical protein